MATTLIKYWSYTLLWFSIILLSSCTKVKSQINQVQAQVQPQKLLLFQKTPCYGTCPAYNATFYTDGSVFYEGFRYAPVQDTLTLQLSKEQLQTLKITVKDLDYTSLKDNYLSPYTDLPSSYLTFYEQDKEVRRIKHQQEGPKQLQEFIKELEQLVMQLLKIK
ncbi:DUF6438 domain-containing protein [uncultured Pontibacter sp.]|uniref:DUF6438 domain-containing protein n=1 Tax=uncultured Pontibacter sp. TaxID=453356 RepID=UPI00260781A8|nr:DUF6438 domain-containing protein [uncultured Pontibacter sp.]